MLFAYLNKCVYICFQEKYLHCAQKLQQHQDKCGGADCSQVLELEFIKVE